MKKKSPLHVERIIQIPGFGGKKLPFFFKIKDQKNVYCDEKANSRFKKNTFTSIILTIHDTRDKTTNSVSLEIAIK